MKKLFILTMLVVAFQFTVSAQSDKYVDAMKSALKQYQEAKENAEGLAAAEAKFERIAEAEKTQWLPYYYAALIKVTMSFNNMGGDRDKVADEANELITKAEVLEKNNSEILVIKSMIQTAKMIVDPQARFMKNGMEASRLLEEAKKADVTNPRPYMIQATNLKNTPEQYGGGCKSAKPLAEKAVELYAAFKAKNELAPNWGKEASEGIVAACK